MVYDATGIVIHPVNIHNAGDAALTYTNTNRLLNAATPYYYSYCTGGKTGFTDEAGYCLVSTAEKNGVQLMALVYGCAEENARFTESAALFEAGFAAVLQ